MKFEKWMNAIDNACQARFEVSIYDLPDQDFQGYFKEGMTPSEALDEIADQENMDIDSGEEGELSTAQEAQIASLAQSWGAGAHWARS